MLKFWPYLCNVKLDFYGEGAMHIGLNEGSRGHTNFMYYVIWIGNCTIFATIKTFRQKTSLRDCCIFLLDFERFSIQRFLIEDFKMLPFRQFLSYKNVPYIKMG